VLFHEGDHGCDFFVVLAGKVAVIAGYGTGEEEVVSVHGPGQFLGELNLLTGQAVFVTAVVREPGEVLVVPVEGLRQLVTQDPGLGDLILRAYLLRRSPLIQLGTGFRIIGSRFLPDTRGCVRSLPAIACLTSSSTSKRTRRQKPSSASWASPRRKHLWSSGGTMSCATRRMPSSVSCSASGVPL
jgi:CRP-like cAMP-binding protein